MDNHSHTILCCQNITTNQMLSLPNDKQEKHRNEIESLYSKAIPLEPRDQGIQYINIFFKIPGNRMTRQVVFYRNGRGKLIAASIYDFGRVEYKGREFVGVYILLRIVSPEHQQIGIGKRMAEDIIKKVQPDILFSTCEQSPSLYSWINIGNTEAEQHFEVYPRMDSASVTHELIHLPFSYFDFSMTALQKLYAGFVDGDYSRVFHMMKHLTIFMVRKNIYGPAFEFDPWCRDGRKDRIADSLGLTERDGVIVMLINRNIIRYI